MADQAAYTALQNAWRGDSVSTAGAVTRNASSWGTTNGRRLLQSSGSDETRLPASAVGTWTNCSTTCTYEVGGVGLQGGVDATEGRIPSAGRRVRLQAQPALAGQHLQAYQSQFA